MSNSTPQRAADFRDSLGVNVFLQYTDGGYANYQNVTADLNYLGVHNMREGTPDPSGGVPYQQYVNDLNQVLSAGNRVEFVTSPGLPLSTSMGQIDAIAKAHPGAVVAVEGPNEINNFPVTYNGLSGEAAAEAYQKDLYAAVKADPNLSGASVYYFTGYDQMPGGNSTNPATTPGLADFDNQHPYPKNGDPPAGYVARSATLTNESPPTGPAVYTEAGYSTTGVFNGGDADVQAKYTLDMLMDDAQQGISKTYLYQLLDAYQPGSPQGDDGFGLFDPSNQPKEAATAIHNLTSVLADTGGGAGSFTPAALAYSVSGEPSGGHDFLMQKSSGAYDIAVWNEPPIWNSGTKTETPAPAVSETVNLGQTFGTVNVYDPLTGTAPVATYSNVSTVALSVTDHPLIVEASGQASAPAPTPSPAPAPAPAPAPSPAPSPAPAPSSHQIQLRESEDYWRANANFTLSVDGKQVGGTNTVTARHDLGQTQVFNFTASLLPGAHTLGIDFLNDAYGGTPSKDRNLWDNQVSVDGKALLSAPVWQNSAGTYSVHFST